MILQSKTQNLRRLNNLHHVLTANGQTILQKNFGVVPKQQIDLNVSNRSIQNIIEMMGKTKETGPTRTFISSQKPPKLKKPRLQWADYTSVRQYVISDPPTIAYHSHRMLNTGSISVVWQQQLEQTYIRRYNNMHMIHKTLPTYKYDYTDNFETQFRTLLAVVAYDTYFVDPQYALDPYWDEDLYKRDKLEYKDTYNKPKDQIESDNLITDAHVSDALRYALTDFSDSKYLFT